MIETHGASTLDASWPSFRHPFTPSSAFFNAARTNWEREREKENEAAANVVEFQKEKK